jgi:hypothetical protein
MALPILPSTTDTRSITERANVLIKNYNREDTRTPIYALDTGSATAYVIAPIPGIEQYVVGQIFVFKAANANSGTAPTLAVNGLTAGTITYPDGSALVAGDIPANAFVEVVVASTTPTFHLQTRSVAAITNTGATTFLGADAALGAAAAFVDGPNTGSIGASGQVWLITAAASIGNATGSTGAMEAGIFNGSAYIANSSNLLFNTEAKTIAIMAVVTLSGATTFTLRARNANGIGGANLLTTGAATGVANKATSITAVRLA